MNNPSNPNTYTIEDSIELVEPAREGYTFIGWTGTDISTVIKVVSISKGSYGNKEFLANWQANEYVITIVGNGGLSNTITQKYDSEFNIMEWTSREGYELGGLFEDVDLTIPFTTMQAKDITLYVYWIGENKPTDFTYSTDINGIYIAGYKGNGNIVCIPKQIGGKDVISIQRNAFKNCGSLTSIEMPNSVTTIGNFAFLSCTGLTNITIPNSVTSIGSGALHNCSSLTSITIPNSVTSIGGMRSIIAQ